MPKIVSSKPMLVNRGPAGLLNKVEQPKAVANGAVEPDPETERAAFLAELLRRHPDAGSSKIAPSIQSMAVPVASLTPDPNNARVHPEKNTRAIMASLAVFGQTKPIVVRRRGMVVMAGNGTLDSVKRLGWTEVAASVVDMDDAEAAAYGLADNRTAELATWDFKTVARLEKLIAEAAQPMVGWSDDELMALRVRDFTPPPEQFPEVDENIEVEHRCPKCGYQFSGGDVVESSSIMGDTVKVGK